MQTQTYVPGLQICIFMSNWRLLWGFHITYFCLCLLSVKWIFYLLSILSDFLRLNNRIWSCIPSYCKQYMAASSRISLEQSWWIFNEPKSMLDFSYFVRPLGCFSFRLHLYTQCKHQRRLLFSSIIYVWLYGEQCLHKTISKCIVPKWISHAPMSNVLLLSCWF